MTKTRTTLLAGALVLFVGAGPAAACLAMAHAPMGAEHGSAGCDSSPAAPSAALCAAAGTVIPVDGPATPTAEAGFASDSHPGEIRASDDAGASSAPVTPRARSAPIHLLHATLLI